jgi:hypothetical protein
MSPLKFYKSPQLVPVDVAFAVYAMWFSLVLSAGFVTHELVASSSKMDPILRLGIFASDFLTIKALPLKRSWARYSAVYLAVIFYAFLALDANGLTSNDVWHVLAKAPVDVFVISRLFRKTTTKWLSES